MTTDVPLQRKWPEERIPIDLEPLPGFNLRAQVVGHGGAYVKHIQQETRCRVQIKGRGSGFVEHGTNQESDEPMYLHVAYVSTAELWYALLILVVARILRRCSVLKSSAKICFPTSRNNTNVIVKTHHNGLMAVREVAKAITRVTEAGMEAHTEVMVDMAPVMVDKPLPALQYKVRLEHPELERQELAVELLIIVLNGLSILRKIHRLQHTTISRLSNRKRHILLQTIPHRHLQAPPHRVLVATMR